MKNILPLFSKIIKKNELLRYISIGGLCALTDIALLYFFVNHLRIWYLTATTISFVIVTFFGYFGQKYFTFRDLSKNHKKQITIFFIVAGVGLTINALCMFFFVSVVVLWYITSNIITKFVVLIWNFLANKYITFKS